MCHVYINSVCVCQQCFGGHWRGPTSIVPQSFVFVCICVYQEVESVHFGLVMFAEGQSGPVPKTSRWSQPNLGKYATHAPVCTHTQILRTYRPTHRVKHIMHMMQTNKHESRFFLSCLSLYFPQSPKHACTNIHLPTENHHLSWLRNRLAIHLPVHFSGEWPCA